MSNITSDFNKAATKQENRENAMLKELPQILTSKDAYNVLLENWNTIDLELTEQFKLILLNHNSQCMAISTVATGGFSGCVADIKLVFTTALTAKAVGVIIAHNHPSGHKTFSEADIKLTSRFVQVGRLLELPVIDHLIITPDGYVSFKDEGFMHTVKMPHL